MIEKEYLLSLIKQAFSWRHRPKYVVPSDVALSDIYEDAKNFENKDWMSLSCMDLEKYHSAIFGFSPDAFCYFLPGIISAGIRENRCDLIMYASLIGMLDRGNGPTSWDNFFLDRWESLNVMECESLQKWLLWLSECTPAEFDDNQLTRAFDTLEILSNKDGAYPLASISYKTKTRPE